MTANVTQERFQFIRQALMGLNVVSLVMENDLIVGIQKEWGFIGISILALTAPLGNSTPIC
jgi:hypothetical protein